MFKRNLTTTERWASALGGATLAIAGMKRLTDSRRAAGSALAAAGAGLMWRAATGHCSVYEAAGINRAAASQDTRRQLGGKRGVLLEEATTIGASPGQLYAQWRSLERLPEIVPNLVEVRQLGNGRSRWTARGPHGGEIGWTAEIINDIPGELIAWRTVPDSNVVSAGSIHFDPAPGGRGTKVRIRMQYAPPAGRAGAAVAWLRGSSPAQSLREGLRHFKQLVEAGEIPRAQPSNM